MPIKKHLERVGNQVIIPTLKGTAYWVNQINQELFDGALCKPAKIGFFSTPKDWMAYVDVFGGHWELYIRNQPISRRRYLELLVHECTHAAVRILDGDYSTVHGEGFLKYAGLVARKTGLPLLDKFYKDENDEVI